MITIRFTKNEKELKLVQSIRKQVFVNEQDVPLDREIDGLDNDSDHIILFFENTSCGCARLRYSDNIMKIERVAVLSDYRGKGFGKKIISFCLEHALNKKIKEVRLHAQFHLKDFYASFGFKEIGNTFYDAGILHIEMVKKIS